MSFTSMMFINRRRTMHTNALNSFQRVLCHIYWRHWIVLLYFSWHKHLLFSCKHFFERHNYFYSRSLHSLLFLVYRLTVFIQRNAWEPLLVYCLTNQVHHMMRKCSWLKYVFVVWVWILEILKSNLKSFVKNNYEWI